MSEDTPHHHDLTKLVPRGLLRVIKAHFDDSVAEAVKRYRFNAVDEDSLTGALGHALSTPERIVSTMNGSHFSFAIESYKILGRGPGSPEKRIGADGIFQISVWEGEEQIFGKGLPFQAKREDRYRSAEVIKQAEDLWVSLVCEATPFVSTVVEPTPVEAESSNPVTLTRPPVARLRSKTLRLSLNGNRDRSKSATASRPGATPPGTQAPAEPPAPAGCPSRRGSPDADSSAKNRTRPS